VPAKNTALRRVLFRTRAIRETIKQAASSLSVANALLRRGKRARDSVRTAEEAVAQYEDVQKSVARSADDLSQVNTALAVEVTERAVIESELADTKTDLVEARDDLSQSQADEHEARQLALHDSLTALPNRALCEQDLDHGLTQARRRGWGLAVLFIDIDDFKRINDSYGHDLGDKVLVMVANRLRSFFRGEDTVSRWGGDEFVCLLLEVRQEADVLLLAEEMLSRITEAFEVGGTVVSIECSIGIAVYPADGDTADILLKNADTAMYRAKGAEKKVRLLRG
jgi:diguanylate cyclase (GGDEF)-like protein